jgi:signal transduction histidine kinase
MISTFSPNIHFWAHVLIDGSIGLSYVSISVTLAVMVYHARSAIPYHHMFLAFGAFILSCGLGHFSHIWTMLYPDSPLEGYVGAVTAAASILTAICLPPLVPKVLALVQRAQLSEQRQHEIRQRDEFLAVLSHELKTPLTGLRGYAELLERRIAKRPDTHPGVASAAAAILSQTLRLQRTISELLHLSRLQLGYFVLHPAVFDLSGLVRTLVQHHQLLAEGSHTFVVKAEDDVCISGDEQALEQVLHNLLTNAVKYSPNGGLVEVTVRRDDDQVRITVADEGMGVPEADRDRLFERFYRASNVDGMHISGFGIGLYIVREVVERHGGSVSYVPTDAGGSCFSLTLPCVAPGSKTERVSAPAVDGTAIPTATATTIRKI